MNTFPKAMQDMLDKSVADMNIRLMEIIMGVSSVARGNPPRFMTVTEWLSHRNINASDCLDYPNARTAYEILNSPLGKALE